MSSCDEALPQLQRMLEELGVAVEHVVGAHQGGVAADVARTDVVALQHCHVGDAVPCRQVVGGRETVTATADDDHVIGRARRGCTPGTRPGGAGERMSCQRECRVPVPQRWARDKEGLSAHPNAHAPMHHDGGPAPLATDPRGRHEPGKLQILTLPAEKPGNEPTGGPGIDPRAQFQLMARTAERCAAHAADPAAAHAAPVCTNRALSSRSS